MSVIIDIIEFLVSNELPLRGAVDSIEDRGEAGSGLFLSLFDYMLKKKKRKLRPSIQFPKMLHTHDTMFKII